MFVLKRIPLPPSSNQLYSSRRGRLIKSIEGRQYDSAIQTYALRNFKLLQEIKENIKATDTIRVDRYFVFHRPRVISKKQEYKKLDATNRIKCADDGIAKLLELDDCMFISGLAEKVTCDDPKDEQVIIHISLAKQRTFEDICALV